MTSPSDSIERIHARSAPRPGRWVSAAIVLVIVAMMINALVTNPNFKWDVAWE